ncbi:MAG: hypothetical protein K9K76_09980 [Halanaerobiales bacterium]|nr:hypothetical protein [Halanaerobiales bacterium]
MKNIFKKHKSVLILFLILAIPILMTSCSSDSNPTEESSGLVLTSLEAKNAEELKATFDNDKTVDINNFTPKPLELGKDTNVSFVYDNNDYSGEVKHTIELTGNFNTKTSFIKKLLSPTCFAQTKDQVTKVILFYGDNYEVAEVINGSFELSIDQETPAGLIFANGNDEFVGYLNVDGLDSLPINSLSDDTGSIDLGEINFTGIEGTPEDYSLLNIDFAEKEMLTATDDLFSSIVKYPDLNKNGKIDILEDERLKTMIRGKLMFYANGGDFKNNLTIDINDSMNIESSKFLVDFYSETYSIPNEIEFICENTDINGKSADSNLDGNNGSYFSNPTSGILPADDYKVEIGNEISHTFTVSSALSNGEENLIYVIPKVNLNEDGTISSIDWKFENKKGHTIEQPSNILNSLEIQIDATSTTVAEKYKDYPQGDTRIYNGYPNDINALEHQLTEDIKWEDVGGINMAYNDVFMNHYVISFGK